MERERIKELVGRMTLEEKASMCVGKDFWGLHGVERLGIMETMVSDGPHGLRKQEAAADHLGLNESKPAVCFPAGCAIAASFDPETAYRMGQGLGEEALWENVSVVLGPAMNIKRSPLCGRNFEYYSEDPYLSGTLAAGMIRGIQSRGVGACPKHFLLNNQEYFRLTSNSVVDERTLREIYLAGFEIAVKEGKPWTIMGSYNRVDGTYACENPVYLTRILREEWGFDGYTMTDWGGCNDPVEGLKAGMDLIMPGPALQNRKQILKALQNGTLPVEIVDRAVENILWVVINYIEGRAESEAQRTTPYSMEAGHRIAAETAAECAVLLKNEDSILPLKKEERVLFVGPWAKEPRFQGGGSSHIHPYRITGAYEVCADLGTVSWACGGSDLEATLQAAAEADKVVIFTGLPENSESEGIDRKALSMPQEENDLILAVAGVQPNVVVVLHNGAPVTMPWLENVKGVLEMYLGGEAVGAAAASLLYGTTNPSGRLPETFPLRIEDTPAYPYYGTEREDVPYREGILVGYRYYETMRKPVLFPFGYGLSYTTFAYSDLFLDRERMRSSEELSVCVTVTNTGACAGKEVVQLYVSGWTEGIVRPVRELRGISKIRLEPGESRKVSFKLGRRDFAYWNEKAHSFLVSEGSYGIEIGTSASHIVLSRKVYVCTDDTWKPVFHANTPLIDFMKYEHARELLLEKLKPVLESMMPQEQRGQDGGEMEIPEFFRVAPVRSLAGFGAGIDVEAFLAEVNGNERSCYGEIS